MCNFSDGWVHDRDHARKNKLINWDKEQFTKFNENMNWGNAVFGSVNYYYNNYVIIIITIQRQKWKNIDGNLKRRFICIKDIKDKSFQSVISLEHETVNLTAISESHDSMQSSTHRPATRGVPVITNSMGTSLFIELKASSSNELNLESLGHETHSTEFKTFGTITWGMDFSSRTETTTDTMSTTTELIATSPTSMPSNTTTLATSSAQITTSIHALTTTSQNISNETHALTNTSNQFQVDVHVEQLVISGEINGHKCINDSSKSTEKLPKDEKDNLKSTKIWVTVGVFSGWLKNEIELLYLGLMRHYL